MEKTFVAVATSATSGRVSFHTAAGRIAHSPSSKFHSPNMMMAHDSTPTRPQLSKASVEALESALQKYLADDTDVALLQPALQRIATEAREKKMQAEQLLVQLKEVWYNLPQIR